MKIVLLFLITLNIYAGEFLKDAHFRNGFHLLGNNDADPSVKKTLRVEEEATGQTVWRLAEWNSNSTLATYEDYHSWANDSSSVGWRWSNPSKSITVGFGRGSADITFAINVKKDLNNLYSEYPDSGYLDDGGYINWWPHLLIEQKFDNPVGVTNNLKWAFDAKLVYWSRYRDKDSNGNLPKEENLGEFVTYLLLQNKYNHEQQLWLGMTIFDTSSYGVHSYSNPDVHTNINIYKTGVPQVRQSWSRYEVNVADLLQEAIQAYNYQLPITMDNAEIIAFNMGWEVRGLDIGTMSINNLSLYTYPRTASLEYSLYKPTNLKTSFVTATEALLTWEDNSNNENGFKIYENEKLIAVVPANTTSYQIKELVPNTEYVYSIEAYNDFETSDKIFNTFKTKDNYYWLTIMYYIMNG